MDVQRNKENGLFWFEDDKKIAHRRKSCRKVEFDELKS